MGAGIALTGDTTEQLAVNPGRLVKFGQDYVQATCIPDCWMQFDVSSATSHVGRDCNATGFPGGGDDFRFLAILSRVEHER